MVEGTKTDQICTEVRDMQNFIESNIEMTIRKYCTEADRPLTSNRNTIVSSHNYKLIFTYVEKCCLLVNI